MTAPWKNYQEETASYFRSLGLDASTDITVKGARTSHDIDVLVKSYHVGFDVTWIVECKLWKTPVSKLHVLALREIVSDIGADRGILLAESGFQSGAIEAANLTNVQVTSLSEVQSTASNEVYSMRLRELYDRVESCKDRYWNISKDQRIDCGLRPERGSFGYSGTHAYEICSDLLSRAFRGLYPFRCEALAVATMQDLAKYYNSPSEVVTTVEDLLSDLESKLDNCEEKLKII